MNIKSINNMTETEKLVNEGFISNEFLQDEVKCDYRISSSMKKTWAIQLDLTNQVLRICERHGLSVWVAGGSLLGAIRHKGYIPWDDDIDLFMPRNDFDCFMAIAGSELVEPYFLESPYDSKDYYFSFARIRNRNTHVQHVIRDKIVDNGVFIDLFPLDGVSPSIFNMRIRFQRINIYKTLLRAYTINSNPHWYANLIHKLLHWKVLGITSLKIRRKIHRIASKTKYENADQVALLISPYVLERNIFRKKDYEETIWLPFENLMVPCPAGYDGVLKSVFGDYMQLPPIEERGAWHHFRVDPDVPFQESLSKD